MRNPGIYPNVNIEEYHAEEGISSSGVSLLLDCPKRYWYEYLSPKEKESETDKYKIGRALHMMVLEMDKFTENFYCLADDYDMRTKIGKEAMEKARIYAHGRTILKLSETEMLREMSASFANHPIAKLIEEPKIEHSVYWDAGIYNTRFRARPDIYTDKLIIDVKTTDSIASFQRSIFNFGYHRQAAMQIDGLKSVDGIERQFGLFVIEKKAPYLTACFVLEDAAIDKGRQEYHDAAGIYTECKMKDEWPGYFDGQFELVKLPKWLMGTNGEEVL